MNNYDIEMRELIQEMVNYPYDVFESCCSSYGEAAEWALKTIDAQKAMAREPIYNFEEYGDALPHCPWCEKTLPRRSAYGDANFCHICGQAIKWNECDYKDHTNEES